VEYKSQNKKGHVYTTARCNQQTVNNADSTEGYTNFSIILSLKQQIQCKIYCPKMTGFSSRIYKQCTINFTAHGTTHK